MIIYIVNYGEREKSVFFGFFSGWADDLKISRVEFRLESRRDGFMIAQDSMFLKDMESWDTG